MNIRKCLPAVGGFFIAAAAFPAQHNLPTPGPSEYVDAESCVNVPLPVTEGRHIRLALAFDPSPTNAPMMMVVVGRGLRSAPEMEGADSTPAVRGLTALPMMSNLHCTTTTSDYDSISNWTARGAYCDWQCIDFPDAFRFPVGTNLIDAVTLLAWGEVGRVAPRPPE